MNKRVYVVTGANGFLGNNLVRKLITLPNASVRALVLKDDKTPSLDNLNVTKYIGDVTDINSLMKIFETKEDEELVVFHCAAIVYIKNKPDPRVREVNVKGTENIVKMCLANDARLIYFSSVHAIPVPTKDCYIKEIDQFDPNDVRGIYSKTKSEAAKLVLDYVKHKGLKATILHPSGMIGPGDYGMTHLTKTILNLASGSLKVIVNGGYDFIDVRDVCDAAIKAVDNGEIGGCYILSNRYMSIKELMTLSCFAAKQKRVKVILPLWLVKLVSPICELYYNVQNKVPLFTRESLYVLGSKCKFDNSRAKRDLALDTRSTSETIKDTISWFEDIGKLKDKKKVKEKKE